MLRDFDLLGVIEMPRTFKEKHRNAEDLFDLEFYSHQAGKIFTDKPTALAHFCSQGQALNLNPSPFFFTKWYRWQNSMQHRVKWYRWQNYTKRHGSLVHHFVHQAKRSPVDPTPFLDSVGFLNSSNQYANMLEALIALTDKRDLSVSAEIEEHFRVLWLNQIRVHQMIRSVVVRKQPTSRRRLVWVQAGPKFSTSALLCRDSSRSWDLMCNWYSNKGVDISHGEIHIIQPGTKSTAIHHVMCNDPELLSRYDQILFLDDDITVTFNEVDRLFDLAEQEQLEMFQASLLRDSYCVWPDLFKKNKFGVRQTTGVEIMMPGFTRDALFAAKTIFGKSVSGFGLDFMISETLRKAGKKIGVIDEVSFGHFSNIDESDGAYYKLMRSLGINQKLELYEATEKLGVYPSFCDV